jgi:hypothetical protein
MHAAVNHFASPEFWYRYGRLPREVRELADKTSPFWRSRRGLLPVKKCRGCYFASNRAMTFSPRSIASQARPA